MSARARTVPSASVESSTFDALNRAVRTFPGERLAVVSAFGPGSAVLFHLLAKLGARVPVIFVDTLHHFPETLEHVQRVRDRYQQLTKVAPFRTATARLDAYITGRRRDQSAARADLEVIESGTPVRINPLAHWTREDVWRFIGEHGLPYNPLHDRGYASIGDAPLTTPVDAAEPERAGRWRDTGRLECGIHVIHAQRGALE
jgi:phosphoadenosine phosphosulfate reductase